MIRDRAITPFTKRVYSILSFGWSGRAKDWQRFEEVSLVLAGLATPLVLSVHTIVSMDFATSVIPGWHTTIFPPYFVAGAIFSGFAMVQTLLIIVRKMFKMEEYITIQHIEMIIGQPVHAAVVVMMTVRHDHASDVVVVFWFDSISYVIERDVECGLLCRRLTGFFANPVNVVDVAWQIVAIPERNDQPGKTGNDQEIICALHHSA